MRRFKEFSEARGRQIKYKAPFVHKVDSHNWVAPKHDEEHDEVHTQHQALKDDPHTPDHVKKQLDHLKKKTNYVSAMKRGQVTHVSKDDKHLHKIGNSDVADKRGTAGNPEIEKAKHDRVSAQFNKSKEQGHKMTTPVMLHDRHTGHRHLLAGNTRLSHGINDKKVAVPVHTLSYDSSKQK